jgi:hypothetical protein
MVPFSDVMEFAQAHHPCGGIAPAVRSKPDGGYLLTLTCVCSVMFHRDVTPEEAAHLPSSSTAPPSRRRAARARPSPSPELERVMQEALAAEEEAAAAVVPATERKTRHVEPSRALEDVLREALAAEEQAAEPVAAPPRAASAAGPSPKRSVAPLAASSVEATVRAALLEQERLRDALSPESPHAGPRSRGRWISVALLVAVIAGGAAFYVAETFEPDAPVLARSSNTPTDESISSEAPTYGNAVMALRRLQVASVPTTSLPSYASRVNAAQAVVGRYVEGEAPPDARRSLRAILDLHVLAVTAWQLRAIDTPRAWEPVSRSATLELCDPVRNAAYIAERPGQNSAQTRGRAIAASIPLLWECAANRLAQLDSAR